MNGLNEKERFEIVRSKRVDEKVENFLRPRFDNLEIEILSYNKEKLFDLMNKRELNG